MTSNAKGTIFGMDKQGHSQEKPTPLRSKRLEKSESRCKTQVARKFIPPEAGWCTDHWEGASVYRPTHQVPGTPR